MIINISKVGFNKKNSKNAVYLEPYKWMIISRCSKNVQFSYVWSYTRR